MALEATHIRFALDLREQYSISDTGKFLSGAIYPDSRYLTGLGRSRTHSNTMLSGDPQLYDDFRKGWHSHLLCDKVQSEVMKEKLPRVFVGEDGQESLVWVKHTALKALQDIDDVRHFSIWSFLPGLEYIETPNGEDRSIMVKYNQMFQMMYSNPEELSFNTYYHTWVVFGVDNVLAQDVIAYMSKYQAMDAWRDALPSIYAEMLARAKQE